MAAAAKEPRDVRSFCEVLHFSGCWISEALALTTTMPQMAKVITAFRQADEPYPIIVGGAPLAQDFADHIGADGYGADAPGAVNLVHRLVTTGGNWKQAASA